MRRTALLLALAACGVRTPPAVDVDAILRAKGPVAARFDLEAAVLAEPRDVGAHLALAALADKLGRPSEAIAQLEIVENLGGPLGIRWHADDRARLARLIAARGETRLARGAASAAADLERARGLGARIDDGLRRRARIAAATVALRHIDAGVREQGRRALAIEDEPQWRGARPIATAADRGAFGAWLWSVGAKRGAWIELAAWHDHTPAPREPRLEAAYASARTWWTPVDGRAPDADDLAGPERCRFGACSAAEVVARDDGAELHALLGSQLRTREPAEVVAWIQVGLRAALRGEGAWGAIVRMHVDLPPDGDTALPPAYRTILARLADRPASAIPPPGTLPIDRLVAAATRALAGEPVDQLRAALGPLAASGDGATLIGQFEPIDRVDDPRAAAIVLAVGARVEGAPPAAALRPLVVAFRRDPAIAERLGRDLVATAADAAVAHAALGALFEALDDPARARLAWQAAVDASPEPAFVQGLAEIQARAGDPDAAMVTATKAAAASGDPAVSWMAVARALHAAGSDVVALDAARSALDLASADTFAAALDVASDASRALGREVQVADLARMRTPAGAPNPDDPTDVAAALAAHRETPSSATLARLWVASRWNPRDVASRAAILDATPATDARQAAVIAELVRLAGDRALATAALQALR